MAVPSFIKDPLSGIFANVEKRRNKNKLHVITEPYRKYKNRSIFFTNDTHGFNMNVDGSLESADSEGVHNGTDDTWWEATAISGNWNFSSSRYAYDGNYSISAKDTKDQDTAQFKNDEYLEANDYHIIEGWIYITEWRSGEKRIEVYAWDTDKDERVSDIHNIGNYVNTDDTNIWQKFSINMSFYSTYDSIRIRTINKSGDPPEYYLDEIKLVSTSEGSGPFEYKIQPPIDYNWEVLGLGIAMSAPFDATLTDSSMPKIPWDGFLGLELDNGMVYQRSELGVTEFSITINHLIEILNQHNAKLTGYGSESENTWVKIDMDFTEPYLLEPFYEDSIKIIVRDNLSSFNYFRMIAEVREYEHYHG